MTDAQETTPAQEPRVVRTSSRKGLANSALGTRNLMMIAALSVVGLVFLIPLSYFTPAVGLSPNAVVLGGAIMGLWVIPYLLPATVVRRPGAVMIAALIMGIVGVFTTPAGPSAIFGNLMGGLFIELPLAVMLYRKWTWWAYLICAGFFGLVNGLIYPMMIQGATGLSLKSLIVVLSVVSALIGGGIVISVTRLLNRAGVGVDRNN